MLSQNPWTPPPYGVGFTNILQAAFTCPDPNNAKNTVNLSVFFALLGSGFVKASWKMLVKFTLGRDIIFEWFLQGINVSDEDGSEVLDQLMDRLNVRFVQLHVGTKKLDRFMSLDFIVLLLEV